MITRVCLASLKSGESKFGSVLISPWDRNGACCCCCGVVGWGLSSSSSSVRSITPKLLLSSSPVENNADAEIARRYSCCDSCTTARDCSGGGGDGDTSDGRDGMTLILAVAIDADGMMNAEPGSKAYSMRKSSFRAMHSDAAAWGAPFDAAMAMVMMRRLWRGACPY